MVDVKEDYKPVVSEEEGSPVQGEPIDPSTKKEVKKKRRSGSEIHKPFVCMYSNCNMRFAKKNYLEYHFRVHTGEKTYLCMYEGCEKGYARHSHLKRHVEKFHKQIRKEPTNRCPVCEKLFADQEHLQRHLKTHEKRKHKCKYCGKEFLKHNSLLIHEYEHTGVKPFACTYGGCQKTFLLPSKLHAHMDTHRAYPCDYPGCETVVETWVQFRKHKKECHPTVYTCAECNRTFSTRTSFVNHYETHLKERNTFECPYDNCSRYYFYEKNLNQHIKSAHADQCFTCLDCNKRFLHKKTLVLHMRIHNPDFAPAVPKKKEEKPQENKTKKTLKDQVLTLINKTNKVPAYRLSGIVVEDVKEMIKEIKSDNSDDSCQTIVTDNGAEDATSSVEEKGNEEIRDGN